MKRFSEQLYKKSQSVKLSTSEKTELQERLISYMEYHPLPAELKSIKAKLAIKPTQNFTESFTSVSIPFAQLFKYSTAFAAFILVVIPVVAQKAIPGDTLYAVKVQFNEEVIGTLTFGSYEKVEWETQRLNRRISEARLLASEGRLTEEVEAKVAKAIKTHTENAKREIEVMRSQDEDNAAIASIELDTTLQVQSAALRGKESMQVALAGAESVNLIANVIDESRSQTEKRNVSTTPPAYIKLMARVEQNTTRIHELLSSLKPAVEAEQLSDVTRRIEDIERAINLAIETSATNDEMARTQMVEILQSTQKLIVYMTEIEVKQTIDIQTLVPVVLTEKEEIAVSENLQIELNEKLVKVEELTGLVTEENVLEKVAVAKQDIDSLVAQMASSSQEFKVFESIAKNTITLVDDVIKTLEKSIADNQEAIITEVDIDTETASTSDVEIEVEAERGTTSSSGN